ncbi:hypothetical protein COLO4_26445 [Corchorus olitorius]|uniref:Uncharacterized protein n=1 Tax=Corchorus olitorius TaxID=93759 RepID=A0A1R3HWZ7_9ROSI|nr:hypothetical protein COLO4_26445 [Corchorus olitorius]
MVVPSWGASVEDLNKQGGRAGGGGRRHLQGGGGKGGLLRLGLR